MSLNSERYTLNNSFYLLKLSELNYLCLNISNAALKSYKDTVGLNAGCHLPSWVS